MIPLSLILQRSDLSENEGRTKGQLLMQTDYQSPVDRRQRFC